MDFCFPKLRLEQILILIQHDVNKLHNHQNNLNLDQLEEQFKADLPERLIERLKSLNSSLSGYQISRLEHSLQGATRAHRAGENMEMVMAVLFHDIGDELAPYSHSEMAAALLRPFVSEKITGLLNITEFFRCIITPIIPVEIETFVNCLVKVLGIKMQ